LTSLIQKTVQQTTSKFHQAFPTIIYEKKLGGFLPSLYKSFEDAKFDNTTGRITGELNGKVLVHQDKRLDHFFRAVKGCVREYIDHFAIDKSTFEINFAKTWFTICDPGQHFPVHYHSCSHISWVYYIQTPGDPIILTKRNPNEINQIVDQFYNSYLEEVAEDPTGHAMDYIHIVMDIEKKIN